MFRKVIVIFLLIAGVSLAQALSPKEVANYKAQIGKNQKEIARLKKKLAVTEAKQMRIVIMDKIDMFQGQINKIERQLYPKPAPQPKVFIPKVVPIAEVITEEAAVREEEKTIKRGFYHEVGGAYGFFAGATAFLGEVRFPVRLVLGPATTSFRVSTGLAQSSDASQRYVPVNFDLIFNFPAGWFTGVNNYIGAGLNYVVLTSEQKSGTVGGEIFYGVESDGFGGIVFGEIGYAYLRTGFSPSHKGLNCLVGFRKPLGF